jgi:hypothetical protein
MAVDFDQGITTSCIIDPNALYFLVNIITSIGQERFCIDRYFLVNLGEDHDAERT